MRPERVTRERNGHDTRRMRNVVVVQQQQQRQRTPTPTPRMNGRHCVPADMVILPSMRACVLMRYYTSIFTNNTHTHFGWGDSSVLSRARSTANLNTTSVYVVQTNRMQCFWMTSTALNKHEQNSHTYYSTSVPLCGSNSSQSNRDRCSGVRKRRRDQRQVNVVVVLV